MSLKEESTVRCFLFPLGTFSMLTPSSDRAFAIAASMFMNSNSLPIALMQSLVVTVHGLKWGKDDTRDGMLGRALTYLVLHSTFGMMLRWSYGVKLLAQADDPPPPPPTTTVESPREESLPPIDLQREAERPASSASETSRLLDYSQRDYSSATLRSTSSAGGTGDDSTKQDSQNPSIPPLPAFHRSQLDSSTPLIVPTRFVPHTLATPPPKLSDAQTESMGLPPPLRTAASPGSKRPLAVNRRSHFFYSFPNTPAMSRTSLSASREGIDSDAAVVSSSPPSPPPTEESLSTRVKQKLHHVWKGAKKRVKGWWKAIDGFMTPPLYAALLSLLVACIPPVQHTLAEHMRPIKGAISSAGACSIPITLVVLGGYFWREPPENGDDDRLRTNLPQQHEEPHHRRTRPASEVTLVGSIRGAWDTLSRKTWKGKGNQPIMDVVDPVEPPNGTGNGLPHPVARSSTSVGTHKGEARTVLVAIVARMIVTPLVLLPVMALVMSRTTMRLFDEYVFGLFVSRLLWGVLTIWFSPVFVLSNVLFISSPPALTLAQVSLVLLLPSPLVAWLVI